MCNIQIQSQRLSNLKLCLLLRVLCLWILFPKSALIHCVISDFSVFNVRTGFALVHKNEKATTVEIAEFVKRITDTMPDFMQGSRQNEMDIRFPSPTIAASCFEKLQGARFKDKTVVCKQWRRRNWINKESQWIHFKDLPPNTTREQIANLIQREAAVFINEKNIYIQRRDDRPDALIDALVECSNIDEAQKVIQKVKMQSLKGHKVWCQEWNKWNENCAYLELSNLHPKMDKKRLLAHLQEVTGIQLVELEKLSMNWQPQNDQERARKVIIGFSDVRFAASALNGGKLDGREISVKWHKTSSYKGTRAKLFSAQRTKNGKMKKTKNGKKKKNKKDGKMDSIIAKTKKISITALKEIKKGKAVKMESEKANGKTLGDKAKGKKQKRSKKKKGKSQIKKEEIKKEATLVDAMKNVTITNKADDVHMTD